MVPEWFAIDNRTVLSILVSAIVMILAATAIIRIVGLRALSKMGGFDFIVTVALGSIVASVVATSTSLWHGTLAIASVLGVQWVVAKLRRTSIGDIFDNEPLLLMNGQTVLHDNMAHARVTDHDLVAKLREANVTRMDQVLAVVLETTGDVSVLHGEGPLDDAMLEGVRLE